MASFFRPYFSLKLAASRTSAKWAADPGCEGGEPGRLHSGNIVRYLLHAQLTSCSLSVNHTNLFRLVVLNSLFENVDGAVDVFLVGVHRYQSGNLRSQ